MSKIQRVPDAGFRVATGPVKFGNDWCGYFFRGDETPVDLLSVAVSFLHNDNTPLGRAVARRLDDLVDILNECQEPRRRNILVDLGFDAKREAEEQVKQDILDN